MIRRAMRGTTRLLAGLGLGLACVWALSRLITDSWRWSQYLFWVPQEVYLAGVLVLLALASIIALAGGRAGAPQRRRAAWRERTALGALAALMIAHTGLVRWRALNALTRTPAGAATNALRVLSWNCTSADTTERVVAPIRAADPDLAILANPHSRVRWSDVALDFARADDPQGARPASDLRENAFVVLSRFAITRAASISLGIPSAPDLDPDDSGPARTDPGRAMFFEIDTRERLGRSTIVWVIDLPSDPRLHRRIVTDLAARAIAEWSGPVRVRDEQGRWRTESSGLHGFPAPDLIVGDFNIPRGSGSLARLTGGRPHAFDRAGLGLAMTWPRAPLLVPHVGFWQTPVFHLDHMFLGPALDAARYDIVDPGAGYHRAQVAELVAAR